MKLKITKHQRTLAFVVLISVVSLLIDLPRIPIKFKISSLNVDTSIGGYSIAWGSFNRDLQIKKGLDLSGGVQMTYKADMTGIPEKERVDALQGARDVIDRRINFFGVSEPNIQTAVSGGEYRVIVELPGVADVTEALNVVGKTAQLDFRELQSSESADFTKTDLTGKDLTSAQLNFDPNTGKPVVAIEFSTDGATRFQEITKRNVGRPLAIYLDDQLLTAPNVNEEISGGKAVINSPSFTTLEAKNLAIQLNAGALPVPISLVSQQQISATLGQESIQLSVFAGLVGLIIVGLFMIGNYGKLGILADIALVIYGLISLAVYKLVPVTLTLAGVAGFLLSIGMAVDSNILIFERIKEERRSGRPLFTSMELGFQRAWNSVRDANICTLITSFILFNPFNWGFLNTSGMVRGFALTLALGIFISLFTGIVVTRTLVRVFYR